MRVKMKLNVKTLCSIGALLLCSESMLAMKPNEAKVSNENVLYTKILKPSDLDSLDVKKLSLTEKLKIEGEMNSDQLRVFSNLIQSMPNLKGLDLRKTGLKEVPSEVFDLEKLEILDLSWNSLTDIATELTKMKSLQELYLQGNQITQIPNGIGDLEKLRVFNIKGNNLLSHIKNSQALATTMELTVGNVYGLGFSHENKEFFVGLTGWTSISSEPSKSEKSKFDREVKEIIKKDIEGLKGETVITSEIYYDVKRMTSVLYPLYERVKTMRDFIISNVLSKTIPDSVCNLAELKSVGIDDELSVSAFLPLRACIFRLPDGTIAGDAFERLTWESKLRYDWEGTKRLDLSDKGLSQIPFDIVNLPNLEKLDLSNNKITKLPISLKNMEKLEEINLSGNPYFDSFEKIDDELLKVDQLKFTISVGNEQVSRTAKKIKEQRVNQLKTELSVLQMRLSKLDGFV